ncbi:MAG: PQQ-binding-like beta-propeller repeat protein [Planctomycetes bacterium]|nr:PQQ-binding-like beta-propeller repeat protein [Planctomycetota bacterium]
MLLAIAVFSISLRDASAQETRLERDTGPITVSDADWPWWRGPNRNGIADANQSPPMQWGEKKNILWETLVPGRGHGSPIVVGNRVYLTTADEQAQVQSVLCFEHDTGKVVWKTDVHKGGLTKKGNKRSSQASSAVACDGRRIFANFLNKDSIVTTALDLSGNQIWQQKIADYTVHQGYGSSPTVHGMHVFVTADNKGGNGVVACLNRLDGRINWKNTRPKTPNYSSPIIFKIGGQEQLLLTGCNLVSSFDPGSGRKLWEIPGATTECVTSTVTDGTHIYTSGGYPKNHVAAVKADGSGKVVWENKTRVYVPSMVVSKGYLYAVADAGIAYCWKSDTGEEMWKQRLGGTFNASPVVVGDRIFATNEAGTTFIFTASPDGFEKLGENSLGDAIFATPTYCHDRIFMRAVKSGSEGRQEVLYCIGTK